MSQSYRYSNHPFRFLLYLEWSLLTVAAVVELFTSISPSPVLGILCLIGFGAMGLYLPVGSRRLALLYTLLEFGLVGTVAWMGNVRLIAFMYVPLMVRSCLILPLVGKVSVAVVLTVLFIVSLNHRLETVDLFFILIDPSYRVYVLLTVSVVFALSVIFVSLLINSLLVERQGREKLALANEQLRQYALRIEKLATLQERNRIAREIHDSLGHSLTALNIQIEGGLKLWQASPDQALSFLQEAKRLGSTALQDVRESVSALRSDPLKGESLGQAVTKLTQEFQRTAGLSPICELAVDPMHPLPVDVEGAVYRIIQESLTNSCKHAKATQVHIQLMTTQTDLQLMIADNGKGFQTTQNTTGFGLQGMRERTEALGGSFTLESAPGCGCRVEVRIPLAERGAMTAYV